MKRTLTVSICLAAMGVASLVSAGDNSYIAKSFVNNRLSIDKKVNLDKPYWSAQQIGIFGDGEYTICAGDPAVGAGSGFSHDVNSGAVEIGESGWLDKNGTVAVLGLITMEATMDGEPMDIIDSGVQKWNNRTNGSSTGWRYPPANDPNFDELQNRGCDWHYLNRLDPRDREKGESCWVRTLGVDFSTLEVGDHVFESLLSYPEGNGPANEPAAEYPATVVLHVEDCP